MSFIWPGLARDDECARIPDYYDTVEEYADVHSASSRSDDAPVPIPPPPGKTGARFFSRWAEFTETNERGLLIVYLRRDLRNKTKTRIIFDRPRYIYALLDDSVRDPVVTMEINGRVHTCPCVRIQRRNVWRINVTDAVLIKDFGRSERKVAIIIVNGVTIPIELAWISTRNRCG